MGKSVSVRDLAIGIALGAAAASLLPVFLPEAGRNKRELLKAGMKRTVRALEGGAEKLAELREDVEDLLAEVSAELTQEAEKVHAAKDIGETDRVG